MSTYTEHQPIDVAEIERKVRKLRAEAVANGVRRLRTWTASAVHARTI